MADFAPEGAIKKFKNQKLLLALPKYLRYI